MIEVFIVAWTGGYEAPSYAAKLTKEEAFQQAEDWMKDGLADGDTIDVLRVDLTTMTMERLEAPA